MWQNNVHIPAKKDGVPDSMQRSWKYDGQQIITESWNH